MKKVTLSTLAVLIAAATLTASASAGPRVPQIILDNPATHLQPQIDILNSDPIDVTTEQLDIQRWEKNVSGTGTVTFSFSLAALPAGSEIGIYNAAHAPGTLIPASELYPLFQPTAEPGWYATATFTAPNLLTVTRFNHLTAIQGQEVYNNVHVNDFSFYMKNGAVLSFAQDVVNDPQQARVLTFAGTGDKDGGWFLCFEDGLTQDNVDEDQDFDEAIVFVEAMRPVPVNKATWASLKSLYR